MKDKGLTLTIVVEGMSLNYDEGYGNIAILKKLRRSGGNVYSFSSRQSLRYSIVKQATEQFGWELAPVHSQGAGQQKVVQFTPEATIRDFIEIDLFGYMKTAKGGRTLTRPAVARLTPLISLEPFYNDIEFLNNKWMAERAGVDPNIANIEQHRSF